MRLVSAEFFFFKVDGKTEVVSGTLVLIFGWVPSVIYVVTF